MRGGEKVLEAILELVPAAPIFTLFHFEGSVSPSIESHPITTSFLQRLARATGDYRHFLPLYPIAVSRWDLASYDLVISSSHAVAKNVETGRAPHVSYCHTPMRYVWDRFDDYFPQSRPMMRAAMAPIAAVLRAWDSRTANRVDQFIANSEFVRRRIERFYHRDAIVIHPFVGDEFLIPAIREERDDFHVIISALVPYKRIELAIDAALTTNRRLVVIGDGPSRAELERRGAGRVEFLGKVDSTEIIARLAVARSLILPGVEDFGITVLEALALGTPVVAFHQGGAIESLDGSRYGIVFWERTGSSLANALDEVERVQWPRAELRARAAQFSKARFQREFVDRIRGFVQ